VVRSAGQGRRPASAGNGGLWRIGVDTGGTFTDIVAVREGEVRRTKVPSTPPNFENGVLQSIEQIGLRADQVALLAHGTTVTTNAVITKSGARTGLITTAGFRDVLELRRHNRLELYDILWDPPAPLVPRQLRVEVEERINYSGEIVIPLDEKSLMRAIDRLRDYNIESLAVCLLHSYQNPIHEELIRDILSRVWPELYVSVSSSLLREPQEFERTSTTVINSYVGPILNSYVERLESRLSDLSFPGRLMIMHSGGGLLTSQAAKSVPARTVTSGPAAGAMAAESFAASGSPAAGVMAAEQIATTTGGTQIISLDIGGTSADIAVIRHGKALLIHEYTAEFGLPIRFPAVDLLTIGAGGGSIAWVDSAGTPHVGPQSAGAVPGPACYGRGGTDATVTDATLVLGRLSEDTRLGGQISLDPELAKRAIAQFGKRVGLEAVDAAAGILDITNSNMAKAIRVMTVERGLDPREFVLLCFGGAGPMLGCELAEQLGMSQVLVPIAPGVTSALGTLCVDIVHDVARSYIVPLKSVVSTEVDAILEGLEVQARQQLDDDQVAGDDQQIERSLDLRYIGQVKTLSIPLPAGGITEARLVEAQRAFLTAYERQYHYVTEEIDIEVSVLRVRGRGLQPRPRFATHPVLSAPKPISFRSVHFRSGHVNVPVYSRDHLGNGAEIGGPLIVTQLDSTTVVPPGWQLHVDSHGNLRIQHLKRSIAEGNQSAR
jgi:N-methylhydantoinase A